MKGATNIFGCGPKTASGTYVGTGSDITLSFVFKPQMLGIRSGVLDTQSLMSYTEALIIGKQTMISAKLGDSDPEIIFLTWSDDKTVTLYKGDHGEHLLSREGKTYDYFAIGE